MKRSGDKTYVFFALVATAIIILATFTVVTQYQVKDLTATAKEKESLPLIVSISADKTSGIIPLEVSFTPIVSNTVGSVEYHWDFGDGNISKETNPTYIYQENGTFVCNLTVKDKKGKETSGSVKIKTAENHPPTVSIEFPTDKPRRPKIWLLEYILPTFLHIENFGCEDYRGLRDKGLLDSLFKGKESFFTLEAEASDQDGDEIVSYEWVLKGEDYTKRRSQEIVEVSYNYTGKTIDIPAKDIYPARPYSITLIVTDSAGKKRSENLKFAVLKSKDAEEFESFTTMSRFYKTKWISEMHSGISGMIILAALGFLFNKILKMFLPDVISLPAGKLLFMLFLSLVLQTDPDDYTDETYTDVIERVVHKPRLLVRQLPKRSKGLLDWTENLLEKLDLYNLSSLLQILEEDINLDNKRPIILDPFPESSSINVPVDCPQVSITVEDPEGDLFNVTISGDYVNDVTYTDEHNGTFVATLISPLPETQQIIWNVEVIDQNGKIITEAYQFTTLY